MDENERFLKDMELLMRLNKIQEVDLEFKPRDNGGELCPPCRWPILMRPEFDFPDRTDSRLSHGDRVFCICGEEYSCDFCGTQLTWGVQEFENTTESFEIFRRVQDEFGVDVTTTKSKAVVYTFCEFNHPQGPLPRPGQSAQRWWQNIRGSQADTEWDEKTYNRLMACFEVYFKIGLSIGAVQVGLFLAWHLCCEDMDRTAAKVLRMVRTLIPSLNEEQRICHEIDVDMLYLYVRIHSDFTVNDSSVFENYTAEIVELEGNLVEIALQGHEPNGAPQFLHHIKQFIETNSD